MQNKKLLVSLKRGNQTVVSNNPEWNSFTEDRLNPDTNFVNMPEMVFSATDKSPSATRILRHLLWINKMRVADGQILLYDEERGMFEKLDRQQEWLKLSKFFHPRVQQIVGSGTVREALIRLRATPSIQISDKELNSYQNLINVKNGMFDICNQTLLSKSSSHFCTYELNTSFVKNTGWADCPTFASFCQTSLQGDAKKIKLLLQILGYLWSRVWGGKESVYVCGRTKLRKICHS